MSKRREFARFSEAVVKTKRWKRLRLQVIERDGWQCVKCGNRQRLEVDHIEPVRDAPELSFVIGNLQTLCCSCHARKTRIEVGHKPLPPERQKWRDLLSRKELTCSNL